MYERMLGRRLLDGALILSAAMLVSPQAWSQAVPVPQTWVNEVNAGEVVLLTLHVSGDNRLAGPLRHVESDYIVLGSLPGYSAVDTAVALALVDSAWVMKPRGARGLLIGSVVGAVFGFGIASQKIRFC